jgi:hypothetical protein
MTASDHSYESPRTGPAWSARPAWAGCRSQHLGRGAGRLRGLRCTGRPSRHGGGRDRPQHRPQPKRLGHPRPRQRHRRGRGVAGGLPVRRVRRRPYGPAGRLLNGLAVFLLAVVLVAAVGAIAASQADAEAIGGNLRSLGIPTTGTEWGKAGTMAGIGSLAAMLLGALFGGVLGERRHSKLTRRAVSGKYRTGRDHQPAERDHDRPATTSATDPRPATRTTPGRPASPVPPPRRHSRAAQPVTPRPLAATPASQALEPPYDQHRARTGKAAKARPPSLLDG